MSVKNKTNIAFKKITTQDIICCGMFAAILTVISQISIPTPGGVPLTIQVFGVALVGTVLGCRLGLITTLIYILLGAVGLPVFSGMRGGIQVLTGMAGGYVLAFPIMAALCGVRIKNTNIHISRSISLILGILALAIVETIGGIQWALLSGDQAVGAILFYSLTAFVPKDIILTVLGIMTGRRILRRLPSESSGI